MLSILPFCLIALFWINDYCVSVSPSLNGAAEVHAFRFRYKAILLGWTTLYLDFEASSTEIGGFTGLGNNLSYVLKDINWLFKLYSDNRWNKTAIY